MPRVFGKAAKISFTRYSAVSPNIGFVVTPGQPATSAASKLDQTAISSEILINPEPRLSLIIAPKQRK
jgi:hypothetical protein